MNDFKEHTRYRMTGAFQFQQVGPDGELKYGKLDEMPFGQKAEPSSRQASIVRGVIDAFARECLAIEAGRTRSARDVMLAPQYLFAVCGAPKHVRSDHGPEFVARSVRRWLDQAPVGTLSIRKASPWENGYAESVNGKPRDDLLNRGLFLGLAEARYVPGAWRLECNHRRPHSGIGWQAPVAFAATREDAGACPAATLAGPSVPVRVPAARPATHQPVLSQDLV